MSVEGVMHIKHMVVAAIRKAQAAIEAMPTAVEIRRFVIDLVGQRREEHLIVVIIFVVWRSRTCGSACFLASAWNIMGVRGR
jgi:hypothetical protein